MSKVTVSIATTSVALPTGRESGKLRISLFAGPELVEKKDVDGKEAVFNFIEDGEYTVKAQRLDAAGEELGGSIEYDFTVNDGVEEMYDAPSAFSVVVTAD